LGEKSLAWGWTVAGLRESEVLKKIKMQLRLFCPSVIWCDRLQSGVAQKGPYYVRLCKAGTPDLYAIIRDKDYFGFLLFIEVKTIKGRQTPEQKEFQHMIYGLKHVHYIVAHSVQEVKDYIDKIILDK